LKDGILPGILGFAAAVLRNVIITRIGMLAFTRDCYASSELHPYIFT